MMRAGKSGARVERRRLHVHIPLRGIAEHAAVCVSVL